MLKQFLRTSAALLLLLTAAHAQRRRFPPPLPSAESPGPGQDSKASPLGSPEAEILKRAEIKNEEESYKDTVERAEETARLGSELRSTFDRSKTLGREDLKRLERMEKLARKIRGSAGGSDDEEQLESPPAGLEQAVARLAEVSEKLGESVRKGSRFVVSGAVIERSNELIELIRHVRTFVKP